MITGMVYIDIYLCISLKEYQPMMPSQQQVHCLDVHLAGSALAVI
jgi:hypothetical protein